MLCAAPDLSLPWVLDPTGAGPDRRRLDLLLIRLTRTNAAPVPCGQPVGKDGALPRPSPHSPYATLPLASRPRPGPSVPQQSPAG